MVAPQLGCGPVVEGNAAGGVGGVDRDRQRLEQLSPWDHHGFLHEFWPTTLRPPNECCALNPPHTRGDFNARAASVRRGPLPLSHTRQNVASKIRFRGKRPRREPLNAASRSRRACDMTSGGIRGMRRSARISRGLGCWIDHLLDFSDLGRRKAADLGVLADDGLVLSEIDAKGLVVGHVALDPLNVRTELTQDLVRFCRRPSQLFALQRADLRNIPFDDELAQRHRSPPFSGMCCPRMGGLSLAEIRESARWPPGKITTKVLSRSERGSAQHSHTSCQFQSLAWSRSPRAAFSSAIAIGAGHESSAFSTANSLSTSSSVFHTCGVTRMARPRTET